MPSTYSIRRISTRAEYAAAVDALDDLLALRDPKVMGEAERVDAIIRAYESNRSLRTTIITSN